LDIDPTAKTEVRWLIKDPLLRTAKDPGFSVSGAVKVLAGLMNGSRSCATIARLATVRLGRRVQASQVEELADAFRRLGFLETAEYQAAYRDLVNGIEQAGALDHSWLELDLQRLPLPRSSLAYRPGRRLKAVLVPHVSETDSLAMSAQGVGVLRQSGDFDTIVVVGPNHVTPGFRGAVLATKGFATPSGVVAVDADRAECLVRSAPQWFCINNLVHQHEHCIALQVPFIRRCFGADIRVLPVLVSNPNVREWPGMVRELANRLKSVLADTRTCFLITGDLYHHYPQQLEIWERNWGWLRGVARAVRDGHADGVARVDRELLSLLESGRFSRAAARAHVRGDCFPLPLLVGREVVDATASAALDYRQLGIFTSEGTGVTVSLLAME